MESTVKADGPCHVTRRSCTWKYTAAQLDAVAATMRSLPAASHPDFRVYRLRVVRSFLSDGWTAQVVAADAMTCGQSLTVSCCLEGAADLLSECMIVLDHDSKLKAMFCLR